MTTNSCAYHTKYVHPFNSKYCFTTSHHKIFRDILTHLQSAAGVRPNPNHDVLISSSTHITHFIKTIAHMDLFLPDPQDLDADRKVADRPMLRDFVFRISAFFNGVWTRHFQVNQIESSEIAPAEVEQKQEHSPMSGPICVACDEDKGPFDDFEAPCGHVFCRHCLGRRFELATTDETMFPPRCCGQEILIEDAHIYLRKNLVRLFEKKKIEFTTLDRIYCPKTDCSSFIPPNRVFDNKAMCPTRGCYTLVCSKCKAELHTGDCAEDPATQELLRFAKEQGWQRCRRCKRVVELSYGCNHIFCPCGAEFWYVKQQVFTEHG